MKRKKTKSYWVEDTPEKLDYINQTLYEENMKLNKELAKYKRAFEILKPFIKVYQWLGKDFYELDIEYVSRRISQEKYELLKEVLGCDR